VVSPGSHSHLCLACIYSALGVCTTQALMADNFTSSDSLRALAAQPTMLAALALPKAQQAILGSAGA
jgi:hypothetical protein